MAAAFAFTPFIYQSRTNTTFFKAYPGSIGAGDVLFCYTWQYSATSVCTGVSDGTNGAWTKAFGPIRSGDSNNGNAVLYGWYKVNAASSGAVTPTATWDTSASGGIFIGQITGLAGGGALGASGSGHVSATGSYATYGTTGTLGMTGEPMTMFVTAGTSSGLSAPLSPLVVDATSDTFYFERTFRALSADTSSVTMGYGLVGGTSYFATAGWMTFRDASVSDLSGTATLDSVTASGSMGTTPSDLSGNATLGSVTASGGMTVNPGTITTPVLKNNFGTVLANVTGVIVNVYDKDTGALVVRKTGQSSDAAGIVVILDPSIVPGVTYAYEVDLTVASLGRRLPFGLAT